jgi:magnesium transporter
MKTLTVITVIALPLNVITGFFGMNFFDTEGLHRHVGFWITVAIMLIAIVGLLYMFRVKKWI